MGQFQPGQGKPPGSGRRRGTPNRNTTGLQEALNRYGVDVVAQLTALLPQLDTDKRANVLLNLMDFLYPKRKAVEQRIEVRPKSEEAKELSDEELKKEMARLTRLEIGDENDPQVNAALETLAAHYEKNAESSTASHGLK